MDGGVVILEETTPVRIEMFHHRVKVITQNNFVLICSNPSLKGDKWTQAMPAKSPPQHDRAIGSALVMFLHSFIQVFPHLYVYVQVTKSSSGHSNYDGSKGGSQVTVLCASLCVRSRLGWMDGSTNHRTNRGDNCSFPLSNRESLFFVYKWDHDSPRTLTTFLLL